MEPTPITFVMNGKTYRISADKPEAIRHIPRADREQLIQLLEEVKLQDQLAAHAVGQVAAKAMPPAAKIPAASNVVSAAQPVQPKPEPLGAGDVDDLMARLIMEENRNKKPGLSAQAIYMWAAGILAVIFLLVVLF